MKLPLLLLFLCGCCPQRYVVIKDVDHDDYWSGNQVWGERKDAKLVPLADVEPLIFLMSEPGVTDGRVLKAVKP